MEQIELETLYHQGRLESVTTAVAQSWPQFVEAPTELQEMVLLALYFGHRYENLAKQVEEYPKGQAPPMARSLQTMALWRLGRRSEALKQAGFMDLSGLEAKLEQRRPKTFSDIERRKCRHCNLAYPLRAGEQCPGCRRTSGPTEHKATLT